MTYLGLLDKLGILFNLTNKYIVIPILFGIIMVTTILNRFNLLGNKKRRIINIISFIISAIVVVSTNYRILSKTFDNFLDIFFTNIYFPSIYVYIFMIVSIYVVIIYSIFSKNLAKVYKKTNYITGVSLNLILLVILNIIANDRIDIFSNDSLYTNVNLVSMLELSTNIYVMWLIVTVGIFIVKTIVDRITNKKSNTKTLEVKEEVVNNTVVLQEEIKPINIIPEEKKQKEDNILEIEDIIKQLEFPSIEKVAGPKFLDYTLIEKIDHKSFNDLFEELPKENTLEIEPIKIDYDEVKPVEEEKTVLDKILSNTLEHVEEEKPIVLKETPKKNINDDIEKILSVRRSIIDSKTESINNFTLDNYKLFSRMLKESIKLNNKSPIRMEDMLNLDLLNMFSYEEYSLFKKMLKSFSTKRTVLRR